MRVYCTFLNALHSKNLPFGFGGRRVFMRKNDKTPQTLAMRASTLQVQPKPTLGGKLAITNGHTIDPMEDPQLVMPLKVSRCTGTIHPQCQAAALEEPLADDGHGRNEPIDHQMVTNEAFLTKDCSPMQSGFRDRE